MKIFHIINSLAKKTFSSFENKHIPFINYLFTFFAIVTMRNLGEAFSSHLKYFDSAPFLLWISLVHFTLFYCVFVLILIIFTHYVTREKIEKIARVMLACFILILITPIVDLITTHGEGVNLAYFMPPPYGNVDLFKAFFSFAGNYPKISFGLKTEVVFILATFFCYFRIKNKSLIASLAYTFLLYVIIFAMAATPFLQAAVLNLFGLKLQFTYFFMAKYFALLLPIFGGWICYLQNKKIFREIFKDIRATRILHYQLMLLLGASMAWSNHVAIFNFHELVNDHGTIIVDFVLLLISIFFAGLFSIVCNNIADYEIDKIANPRRPLVSGLINIQTYKIIGNVALLLAILYAALTGIKALLIMLFVMASYYVYSMPPLRLKRVTLLSKFVISCNSLMLILLGYLLIQDNLEFFPKDVLAIFLIGFTVAANFIDLKDTKGDAALNIKTLPVILGEKVSKLLIGLGFVATYAAFCLRLSSQFYSALLIVLGLLQFCVIIKKQYREWQVFLIYLMSISLIIIYFLTLQI